ncbi:hypothetical protein QIH85_23945 [Bradyrhizobium japonicum]|uniref:hypothetical protein n=1 Tax=Bradyrhizobium japonicum TaxID=375 RepID=UPI002714AA76|nr:hypothetical protein [Bradyrhizobium japonicum]WLB24936.1 hypothetical protein QIH85_23945 [Bradyrhizobium japonicum]
MTSPKESDEEKHSLRTEVREALRKVLADSSASAAAKASAARTLMEYFDDEDSAGSGRRASEMSADELDQEIERLTRAKT